MTFSCLGGLLFGLFWQHSGAVAVFGAAIYFCYFYSSSFFVVLASAAAVFCCYIEGGFLLFRFCYGGMLIPCTASFLCSLLFVFSHGLISAPRTGSLANNILPFQ